jgi:hypothetical protein
MPFLYEYCLKGEIDKVRDMITKSYSWRDMINRNLDLWIEGLYGACFGGNIQIVELMIEKMSHCMVFRVYHWNKCMSNACKGGYLDIVENMIKRGANDWNSGLLCACLGGDREIVELMIEKGANDWNYGLYQACVGGNVSIVEIMLDKGATNWLSCLHWSCNDARKEIVEVFLKRYKTTHVYGCVIGAACKNRWIDIIVKNNIRWNNIKCAKQYDIINDYGGINEKTIDIQVKMFDGNLFCSKFNKLKRKWKK